MQTIILNGQEFTRIGYFDKGRVFEAWYPTENLKYLSDRACWWLI
jgi:hypothetical protein